MVIYNVISLILIGGPNMKKVIIKSSEKLKSRRKKPGGDAHEAI